MMPNSGFAGRDAMRARRMLLAVSTILCSGLAVPAFGQVAQPAPVRDAIDGNGVDLFRGTMNADGPVLSAGDGKQQGLTWRKFVRGGGGWGDTLVGTLTVSGSNVYVSFGGSSRSFTQSGSNYVSTEGDGSTLTKSGATYTFTASDGTVAVFSSSYVGARPYGAVQGIVTSVTKPDGVAFTYNYDRAYYCAASKPARVGQVCLQHSYAYRIASVTSSAQYRLNFQYDNWGGMSFDPNEVPDSSQWDGWSDITGVALTNTAISGAGSRSQSFQTSFGGGNSYFSITDAMNRTTTYRSAGPGLAGITRPGSSGEDVTATYDGSGRVNTITTAAGTTTYGYSDNGGTRTTVVTDPLGHATSYVFDIGLQRMTSMTNAVGKTTTMQYDGSGRTTRVTAPEGNYTQYSYDGRGNVTETRSVGKPGSGVADIVTSAGYDGGCSNVATCNSPQWTRDAKGNQTDYSYDGATGNVLSVTAPAAASGVRPQTRYSYTSVNGVSLLSGTSTCRTSASCAGGSDETTSSIGYNANGLPVTVTKGAGDGSLTATVTLGYDDVGNLTSVDGPLSGGDDTVYYRYDADRERVGTIAPDPDGGGPRRRAASRVSYDAKGRATLVETGSVADAGDGGWSGFQVAQGAAATYDGLDRPLTRSVVSGGTTWALTQYSYDHQRLDCVAVRMNAGAWGSLPGSACTGQGAGNDGPDRIIKYGYDAADRVVKTTSGYGTGDQADDATVAFTDNGQTSAVWDAKGNGTSYGYDGQDRAQTTSYADGSYDQVSYDANGNATSRRTRDGQMLYYGYDNLNRLVTRTTPKAVNWETDQSYGYDLLGNLTSAGDSNGRQMTFGYDALGRRVWNWENWYGYRTAWMEYDVAGRRTRETWGDGFYVTYEYDAAGNMTLIRELGSGPLVSFGYDDLGRRVWLGRGNGTSTGYAYDAVGRLSTLTLSGGSQPATLNYTYNAAGQIASRTNSNDAYAWTGAVNVDRGYATNGLNQYTQAGGVSFGYDGRGNLTGSGSNWYSYTAENRLAWTSSGVGLAYDPLGRLFNGWIDPGVSTSMTYDGSRMTAETDNTSGALLRRYVYGPGDDEPLVWYEGSGTGNRRWLAADERGSVVSVTNDAGAVLAINTYDEYGIPGSNNLGRFQYTGQKWLPTLGLYDYKARMYSPSLGRFMQTDPVGYGDGLNWYNYVGGDPVNGTDPSGNKMGDLCQAGDNCKEYYPNGRDSNGNDAVDAIEGLVSSGVPVSIAKKAVEIVFSNNGNIDSSINQANIIDSGDILVSSYQYAQTSFPVPFGSIFGQIGSGIASDSLGPLTLALSLSGDSPARVSLYHYGMKAHAKYFLKGFNAGGFLTVNNRYSAVQARAYLSLNKLPDSYYVVTTTVINLTDPHRVDPHYGQPGGGIEVQTINKTPPGSVAGPFELRK